LTELPFKNKVKKKFQISFRYSFQVCKRGRGGHLGEDTSGRRQDGRSEEFEMRGGRRAAGDNRMDTSGRKRDMKDNFKLRGEIESAGPEEGIFRRCGTNATNSLLSASRTKTK
jgi:hypothetical protein